MGIDVVMKLIGKSCIHRPSFAKEKFKSRPYKSSSFSGIGPPKSVDNQIHGLQSLLLTVGINIIMSYLMCPRFLGVI
jgi:hypothetical protein